MTGPGKLAEMAAWHRAHGHLGLAEHIEAELDRQHRCRRCGRRLTDPASVAAGVGPDCAARQP